MADYRLGISSNNLFAIADISDLDRLPPGPRAVAAGLLSLAGKPGPAFEIAEKIPEGLLLQEESAFLKLAR
jgi:hypothetical protein